MAACARTDDFDATASFNLLFEDRVETYRLKSRRLTMSILIELTQYKSRCKWLIIRTQCLSWLMVMG